MTISSVVQRGSTAYVYNEKNQTSCTISIGNGKLCGFSSNFVCIQRGSTLYVYDDNTYEYYYTYSSDNKELIPKKGTYNYDTNLILNNITNYEVDTISSYALTDSENQLHILADYEPLEEFLESININIHICTEEQQ